MERKNLYPEGRLPNGEVGYAPIGRIEGTEEGGRIVLYPKALHDAGIPRAIWDKVPSILENGVPEGERRDLLSRRLTERDGKAPDMADTLVSLDELPFALSTSSRVKRFSPPPDFPRHVPIVSKLDSSWFIPPVRERDERFSHSFSGVQDKFTAVLEMNDDGVLILRHKYEDEYGNVIIKPSEEPTGPKHVPEVEYLFMRVAATLGLDVPRMWLFRTEGGYAPHALHYAVERFDFEYVEKARTWSKIPVFEVAGFLGVSASEKYKSSTEQLFDSLSSVLPAEDMERFALSYWYGWLIGNGDMHLKNFSLRRDAETDGFRLAPLYDMFSTEALGYRRKLGLPLSGTQTPDFEQVYGYISNFAERDAVDRLLLDLPKVLFREIFGLESQWTLTQSSWRRIAARGRRIMERTAEWGRDISTDPCQNLDVDDDMMR